MAVQGVDDPKITGFVLASALAPKDATPPAIRSLNVGTAFSPNGDGVWDTAILRGRFTESVAWKLTVKNAASVVVLTASGSGSTFDVTWNGLVAGKAVPDGRYTVTVTGDDAWHNGATSATKSVTVDTAPSQLSAVTPAATTVQWFAPNGDGYRDSVALAATQSEHGSFVVRARAADGTLVRNWVVADTGGATSITWDGRDSAGRVVPDGTYTLRVTPVDPWGNAGASAYRTVVVVAALRSVTTSRAAFYPQDGDSLAKTTSLSLTLARPMTVTWTVRNAAGAIVATHLAAAQVAAGTQTWSFDGRAADGTMLPAGHYAAWVSATDGKGDRHPGGRLRHGSVRDEAERHDTGPGPEDLGHGGHVGVAVGRATGLHHPAGQGDVERPDDQDGDEHVQGDVHDQDRRLLGNDHLQGHGQGHCRRDQPNVQELPAPLTASRGTSIEAGDRLAADRFAADRAGPPATSPNRTRPP